MCEPTDDPQENPNDVFSGVMDIEGMISNSFPATPEEIKEFFQNIDNQIVAAEKVVELLKLRREFYKGYFSENS